MGKYDLTKIDRDELQALGIVDKEGKLNLSEKDQEKLSNGMLTDEITLKNMYMKDEKLYDIQTKLSLYEDQDNNLRVKVHPFYLDKQESNKLSKEENIYIMNNDVIYEKPIRTSGELVDSGKEKFHFNPDMEDSFFIKLKKEDGKVQTIWGKELEEITKMQFEKGDKITITNVGIDKESQKNQEVSKNIFDITPYDDRKKLKDETLLIQFDQETKSAVIIDKNKIPTIKAVNGKDLSNEQQEDLKEGKTINVDENTTLKVDPKKNDLFESNKKLLLLSMLVDGGLSFIVIKSFELLREQQENKKQQELLKNQSDQLNEKQVKELEKKIEEANKTYKQELDKLSSEIKNVEIKYGVTQETKEIKAFIHKEQVLADSNEQYKKPQNIVNSEDDTQQQVINMDEEKKEKVSVEREIDFGQEQEEEQSQSRGRSR